MRMCFYEVKVHLTATMKQFSSKLLKLIRKIQHGLFTEQRGTRKEEDMTSLSLMSHINRNHKRAIYIK